MVATKVLSHNGIPVLRLPESIPRPIVAIAAMLVLAGLDILGAVLARRWSERGSALFFLAGVLCFAILFWVYGSSLRYAELVPVTFGWIVALQVGLLLIDRARSTARVPVGHWLAAAAIIACEGYLLYSSDGAG